MGAASSLPHFAANELAPLNKFIYIVLMNRADLDLNLSFRIQLQEEFSRRVRTNERYSVRAFANHLKVDSSTLSQILNGKRTLSPTKIETLSRKLGFQFKQGQSERSEFELISADTFAVIADWYHFAILDLTLLKSFKSEPSWIASKLSISVLEAQSAIQRLLRLGMLVEKNGRLQKGQRFYTNYDQSQTSAAHKEYQRQVIKRSLAAIDNCEASRKDITSITIAADSRKLDQAREKIKRFRRQLCDFLEDGTRDSVFHLALQLYPVTENSTN